MVNYIKLQQQKQRELGRNLTLSEYDDLMGNAGCPKIWLVEYAIGHSIYTSQYLTEAEAMERYNSIPKNSFRNVFQTWDIWGFTERLQAKK